MKRLILSILIFFTALPFFTIEIQHDFFLGESKGIDTAVVFAKEKIKNSIGLYYDSHKTIKTFTYEDYSDGDITSSSYRKLIQVESLGLYYQFIWSPNFVKIGKAYFGMDIPVQIGMGYDSNCGLNFVIGLNPSFKFDFDKCDLLIGYKASAFLAEAMSGTPFLKNSVILGVRYVINKKATITNSQVTTSLEVPDNSSHPTVNIIDGDIETIDN